MTRSKVWFFPYCKTQKSGSVARVRWHLLGMGKKEQISVCNNVPSTKKASIQKQFNELEKLTQFKGSIQTNNPAGGAMLGGLRTSSQLHASTSQLNNLGDVKGRGNLDASVG